MSTIVNVEPLQRPWQSLDPFIIAAHHPDAYPAANGELGPRADLSQRTTGNDFSSTDGWNMYFGQDVPGFPRHPHRGFETVTFARRGWCDHADSLGATGRYGHGDVQWMTAGSGINHSEMFPLLDDAAPNPLDLFQIWINLPARSKFVDPGYQMLWQRDIPLVDDGNGCVVTVIAGDFEGHQPPLPPTNSWAHDAGNDVAIWHIELQPGASCTLPRARATSNRMLYAFDGGALQVDGTPVPIQTATRLRPDGDTRIIATDGQAVSCFVLQGRPIGEPVVASGPFVMNSDEEIAEAYADYRKTSFGGWPFDEAGPTHGTSPVSFARHPDGRFETVERLPALTDRPR